MYIEMNDQEDYWRAGTNSVCTKRVGTNSVGTERVGTNSVVTERVGTNTVGTNGVGTIIWYRYLKIRARVMDDITSIEAIWQRM